METNVATMMGIPASESEIREMVADMDMAELLEMQYVLRTMRLGMDIGVADAPAWVLEQTVSGLNIIQERLNKEGK